MLEISDYDQYVHDVLSKGPRCGCIDAQNLGESSWGMATVPWFVTSFPGGMDKNRVLQIYGQAFADISAACGLKFRNVATSGEANILVGTGSGSRSNFDGPSGTLAWAYLPSGRNFTGKVEVRFDLAETWIDNPNANGILLRNVACHEFCHAVGLSHNNIKNQLLNPYYTRNIFVPQVEDRRQLQVLYGKAATPAPGPTPTPTDPKTPASDIVAAKFLLKDGRILGADTFKELPANAITGAEWSF
jgi:hypothetical protein